MSADDCLPLAFDERARQATADYLDDAGIRTLLGFFRAKRWL